MYFITGSVHYVMKFIELQLSPAEDHVGRLLTEQSFQEVPQTRDRPERLLRVALAVCYHCHACQPGTPREITLLVSGVCGLEQESQDMLVTQTGARWLRRAVDLGEEVARRCRPFLPSVARFCLVATFFEDALRMWFQWVEQLAYLQDHHQCSDGLAVAIVLLNLVGQLVGSALVILHLFTNFAVTLLAGLVLLQVSFSIIIFVHMRPLNILDSQDIQIVMITVMTKQINYFYPF